MAKGKHSVALFEVIQAGKSSSRASSLRTPKWWFKSGRKADASVVASAPAAVPTIDESSAPAPRTPGVDLKLDPDRKRIKFDVSYTSAIVAAFSVIVFVGLAYIIGTHMSRGPAAAMATTDQLRQGPAVPGVMKVSGSVPVTPPINPNPKIDRTETIATPPITPPAGAPPTPAMTTPRPEERVLGLNYTVIQSFPEAEKAWAFEVCDYLNANGVACSVMTNITDYMKYVVVGLEGFSRVRDDTYRAYEQKIKALSDKFAKEKQLKRISFKRFDDPLARQWKGTERAATRD